MVRIQCTLKVYSPESKQWLEHTFEFLANPYSKVSIAAQAFLHCQDARFRGATKVFIEPMEWA